MKLNILVRLTTRTEVVSDFQVNQLHIGVNYLHQLPYAGSFFLINSALRVLYSGRGIREGDLIRVSKRGVLRDPYGLQGGQPPLLESELWNFMEDRIHGVLCVGKAFIVPFIFASLQSFL